MDTQDPTEQWVRRLLQEGTPPATFRLDPDVVRRAATRRRRRRTTPLVVLAAMLVVIGAVVAGVLLTGSTHHAAPPVVPPAPSPAPTVAPSVGPTTGAPSSTVTAPAAVGPTGGPVPVGFTPASATFVSASDGWVLGTAPCASAPCTSVLRTRDGGASWAGIPAPIAPLATSGSTSGVSIIRFGSAADGWAFGPGLWSTHDGGGTWKQLPTPGGGRVQSLETDGGLVIALVAPAGSTQGPTPWGSTIGSDTWRPLGGALGEPSDSSLALTGSDWFALGGGTVVHGSGLAAPRPLPAPCPGGYQPAAVASPRPADVDVVCAGQGAAGSSLQQLVGSTDGGHTWHQGGPARRAQTGIEAASDNGAGILLTAQASGDSVVDRTTDFGTSFTTVLTDDHGGVLWSDMGFTTTTQAVAVLPGRDMYLSHDAGATWSAVAFR